MAGIYVHIPFCSAKCAYCDFYSGPLRNVSRESYVEALIAELNARLSEIDNQHIETVYIGGGTPSSIDTVLLDRIFENISLQYAKEITIECNPDDVTPGFAGWLAHSPVNRVSMGVQSMHSKELESVGRRHTSEQVVEAVECLRLAGIGNLSLDVMYGLPGQTLGSWETSLLQVLDLKPEHLSAYTLMLEPGTLLHTRHMQQHLPGLPSDEEIAAMYNILKVCASEYGLQHYEISNFSMPSFHSRHNSAYWDLTPYIGIGASAHSFTDGKRSYNRADAFRYVSNPLVGRIVESLTCEERINEYLLIRLRTSEGLCLDKFASMFGLNQSKSLMQRAERLISLGTLSFANGILRIPAENWLIADSLLVHLFV